MCRFLKLVLSLSFLIIATEVQAQEVYSVTVPAPDVPTIERERVEWNAAVCLRARAVVNCTQAQACLGLNAPGGSGCTVVQARTVDGEIFAATQAGREGFFIRKLLVRLRAFLQVTQSNQDEDTRCINWRVGNDTVKNAMCAAAGSPVPATVALGCRLCVE